uniref:Uncharacterized protein n=1 Tax=Setaria italica TaxID=4555 RepID=K3YFF9_SETIT
MFNPSLNITHRCRFLISKPTQVLINTWVYAT